MRQHLHAARLRRRESARSLQRHWLHGLSAHGLRHTACGRLASAGATGHEIAAWSGHRTLCEASRYTRSADQRALARAAQTKLETTSSKPASLFDKQRKKANETKR